MTTATHRGAGDVLWRQWFETGKALDVLIQAPVRCDEGVLQEAQARRALVAAGLEAANDWTIPWETIRVMAEQAKQALYRVREALRREAVQESARAQRQRAIA